jgi:hypothetical protein
MQVEQLKERARDNTQKRTILKELIKESPYANKDSKFSQLVEHFNSATVPCFSKTQGRMTTIPVQLASGRVDIRVNLQDKDAPELMARLRPVMLYRAQIQLFSVGVDVNHSIDDQLAQLSAQVAVLLQKLNVAVPIVQQITSLVCKMIAIVRSKFDLGVIAALVVDALVSTQIGFELAQAVWDRVKTCFLTLVRWFDGKVRAQVAANDPTVALTTMMAVLGGTLLMKKIPRDSDINECINGAAKLGNLVRGVTFAWQGLEKLATFVFKKIFEWQTGVPAELDQLEAFMTGVSAWFIDVQELIRLHTADSIARDSQACAHVETLYRQGAMFSIMAAESKADRALLAPFHLHWNILKSYYDKATSSGAFRAGPRVEPLVIYMYGDSGVGKTGLTYPLATELLKIDGIPLDGEGAPDPTREIYMRMVEQEFWDAYKNQRVVIYDDFAQIVDSAGNPNAEFMEIIRTGNLAPYPLHMASLEEKNKTYFTSRVILCTSNLPIHRVRPESIFSAQALRRRFDFAVHVVNKEEYTRPGPNGTRMLDPVLVERLTGQKHNLDVYDLWPVDNQTGEYLTDEPLSYHEFAQQCIDAYRRRFERSTFMFDYLRDYAALPMIGAPVAALNGEEVVRDEDPAEEEEPLRVQVGYEEIDRWLANAREPVLTDLAHARTWNRTDILGFYRVLPTIRHLLSIPVAAEFDAFGRRQLLHAHADYLTNEWRQHLDYMMASLPVDERMWNPEAGFLLWGMCQRDAVLAYSLGPLILEVGAAAEEEEIPILRTLREAADRWKTTMLAWIDKARNIIANHPYLAVGLCVIPVLVCLFRQFFPSTKEVEWVSPAHEGLVRGQRIAHAHNCAHCCARYEHTHMIRPCYTQVDYQHLCGKCQKDGLYTRYVLRLQEDMKIQEGFAVMRPSMVEAEEAEHHPPQEVAFYAFDMGEWQDKLGEYSSEVSKSGDPITKKSSSPRIELTGSGDFLTKKSTTPRVEIGDVGDEYKTRDFQRDCAAQMALDPNALQVSKKVINNMYTLELEIDGKWQARMKMCFVVGRTALTAGHLVPYLERATNIRIWNQSNKSGHFLPVSSLRWEKIVASDGSFRDQLLIAFPLTVQDHSDLRNNLASSQELTAFKAVHGVVITPCDNTVIMRFGNIKACDNERRYIDDASGVSHTYHIRERYEYVGLETKDGDCGAILMGVSSGLARKILGIHVAGATGLGIASPVNIADVERTLKKFDLRANVSVDWDPLLSSVGTADDVCLPEGDFVPVGKSIFAVSTPVKTALRPSKIAGLLAPQITAPSALRPVRVDGVLIDPMMTGLKKAGKIPPFLDQHILDAVLNDMDRLVNSNMAPEHRRVLTNMESVSGVEGDPFLAPISRKTSPGFPWVSQKRGVPGKMRWLGSDEYKLDPEVEAAMMDMEEKAANNIRSPVLWVDTLKDERRPLEKVRLGKTRVFSAGPMHFTLVFRKYFLGFAAHCARNRITNEISIGTNVYSEDWTRTATRLLSKGEKVIAGDFANFDGTLVLHILGQLIDIINNFYGDDERNQQIRRVLWKEIVNSAHLNGDNVYLWTHSQPSGCPLTAILNSMYNSASMRYVWMTQAPPDMRTMRAFNTHVAMVSYGDDNCVNISDDVIAWFNQLTIAEGYAKIGMTYTDETKSGEMIPYRSLSDISYLKRKFVWNEEEHQYVAPLDFSVVLEMTNWVRGDFDLEDKTIDNIETSAFELSLHGQEIFEKWIDKYRIATASFDRRPTLLTYFEYRTVEAVKYGRLAACS